MTISETLKTAINKLVVGMFDMSAGGYYADMEYLIANDMPFESLAVGMGKTQTFLNMYPSYYNGRQFADTFLSNLFVGYSSSAPGNFVSDRDWIEEQYGAGVPAGKIMLDVISALNGLSTSDSVYGTSKQLLLNKTTVASYYTMSLGGGSMDASYLTSMLNGVTYSTSSVDSAISLISANSEATGDNINLAYSSSVTSASIPMNGNSGLINISSGSSLASIAILSSGRDSNITLTNSALAAVASISISGSAGVNLDLSDSRMSGAKTIDASPLSASLTLTLNDTVVGNYTISGGSGNDTIDFGRGLASGDSIDGKAGTNTLKVTQSAIATTDANLKNIQTITLTGSCELDLTNQSENLTVVGSGSSDDITGGSGNDTISGAEGNDIIKGGGGSDAISTGGGMDRVVFEATYGSNIKDTIRDFAYGYDELDFRSFLTTTTNTTGTPSVNTTAASLTTGLDMTTVSYNIGILYGATSGEISAINITTTAGTANKVAVADNAKAVILVKESDTGANCNIYFVEDTNAATTAQTWSVKLVGILENNGGYSATDMAAAANFTS